jgi:hypothetical protein
MSSYVVLTIDTTNPNVEIYAPSYTTRDVTNVIRIEANEPITNYQEFYVIDSNDVRHDYVFAQEDENTWIGRIRFNDLPYGVHTIYARVKDLVNNYSNLAVKPFELRESLRKGNIAISDRKYNDVEVSDRKMATVDIDDREMSKVNIRDYDNNKVV